MTRPLKFLSSLFALGALAVSLHAQAAPTVGTASTPNVIDLGTLPVPHSTYFGNAFSGPTSQTFYDNFTFSLTAPASMNSLTSSINLESILGIGNLSVRLFQGSAAFDNVAPLAQGWTMLQAQPGGFISHTFVSLPSLLAGTYTLQVRGNVFGSAGGTYTSMLNLAPVSPIPEPATYGMLLAGLGMTAFALRRKSKKAAL